MYNIMKLLIVAVLFTLSSCNRGSSDEQIQKEIAGTLSSGVTASVKDGVVTLSGNCPDESCSNTSETAAKNIKGVKTVVNDIVVNIPPPPAPKVEITADDPLKTSVTSLLDAYKTVSATVDSGVVTLTGEIKRSQLMTLMQSVNELKPSKVINKLTIK